MESASEFLRVLQNEKVLSTAHRPLRLRLAHGGRLADDVLLPQRVVGSEAICGGIDYRVACVASSPYIALKDLIALPAELQFVTDRGMLRSVCGIVTEARAGDADGALAGYEVVLRDVFAVMEKRTNSRVFRYQNELEIVQVLCDEWRQSNTVLANAFELELDPLFDMRQFPPREQTMQYNESDAAFVRRLLRRRGIAWVFRPGRSRGTPVDPAHDRTPAHTLVLFNDPNSLPQNGAGTVRYHRDTMADGRDTIHSWRAARRLQPGVSTRHSWDYKNAGSPEFMTATARSTADQGPSGNTLAASLDDYLIEMPHAGNDTLDHWRLGHVRMSRHEFESKCFQGEGSVRDFCVGQYFTLEGHPEIDTHPAPERDFVITELHIAADNNLPRGLDVERDRHAAHPAAAPALSALPPPRAGDGQARVRVGFSAVRRGIAIVPAYDPRTDLPHPPLQSAIVVGPAGEDVHCDALGRVKIRFPGMRTADHRHAHGAGASGSPADSAWVRVASNWAGNGNGSRQQAGALSLPRVGSEVLVAFLGGDPDRPIILAQLYNQRTAPPAFSQTGALPGNRYVSGTRTHEVQGARGNQLRFDDTRGEISAQLASDHGTSELNLGWLTRPRADGSGTPRGEGAELRSDLSVVVRGAQGVLISAEASPQAEGGQLDRAGLAGLADVMQGILDEVGKLATVHTDDEPTGKRLAVLVDKLKRWHAGSNVAEGAAGGGEPILAATAPNGVIIASNDSLALGASGKVDVISAGDAEVAAGKNIFVRAARRLSLFAHELGVRLVAGRGDIVIHTHLGNIQIKSAGRISLVAAERIELEAPDVKIIAPGAQTGWAGGTVTQQTSGRQVFKGAGFDELGPDGATPAGVRMPASHLHTDEYVVLRHEQTAKPVPNQRYKATFEDGRTVTGRTDAEGRTSLLIGEMIGDVHMTFLPDDDTAH
ncbi:type VI secretion system Vgr family protein [Massilia sp. Root335]|uniref:type VI secretion system Vgr family protein n=1 Tax=Massilia sp. Root335 TaxID=1736517 RepID=UPI0006FB2BEE|nr:type VI secretion system Vgr family protein [Massilia sp. Root335]KQV37967.1 type VI secretion protein [Massilia sp. Root335]